MWLMKTLLTSGCTNQRGAGQEKLFNIEPLGQNAKILESLAFTLATWFFSLSLSLSVEAAE
ncbi:hypothetical protein FR762_24590 (plasmid) [Enterobacter sp. E76]|nr:hypothetical protein FR762_24590 [Enterobacter sp. E76]